MKNKIFSIVFSALLFIGAMVCVICDLAISKTLTWSLIPISSLVFAWIIIFPVINSKKNRIQNGLIVLSFSLIPYLYVLNSLIETSDLIFAIGSRMAVVGIIYLWCVFALFKLLKRKHRSLGFSLLLIIPFLIFINIILFQIIAEPIVDIWDILTVVILVVLSGVCFMIDVNLRTKCYN